MLKHIQFQFLFIASLLITTSCSKDDPEEIHEHEINKIVLNFVNTTDATDAFEVEWELDETHTEDEHEEDEDHAHEGHIELAPNASYTVEAKFFDSGAHDEDHEESSHDHDGAHEEGEDITPEIIEEADVHHVFFERVGLSNLTIESASGDTKDGNGFSLNLKTTWTTVGEESGEVKLYLIHEPSTKDGSIRDEFGGEDDVIANFEVYIEVED